MPPAFRRPCAGEAAWLSLGPRASSRHRVDAGLWRPPPPTPPRLTLALCTWRRDTGPRGPGAPWVQVEPEPAASGHATGSAASVRAEVFLGRSPEVPRPHVAPDSATESQRQGAACTCPARHPSPRSHLGGEGGRLPVVVQHLLAAQAVVVDDVPLDSPEEVRRFVFYQPGLARKRPLPTRSIQASYLWVLRCKQD